MSHDVEDQDGDDHSKWVAPKSPEEERGELIAQTVEAINNHLVTQHASGQHGEGQAGAFFYGDKRISIQASETHLCKPKSNTASKYEEVELGSLHETPPDYLLPYQYESEAPEDSPYANVPIELVAKWLVERSLANKAPSIDS